MEPSNVELKDILAQQYDYTPTIWHDKVIDPEGDNSHPGVKFTARRGNNMETGINLAHERLNNIVLYTELSDRTQRDMRFQILLLKASVTSGLTSNILVDNFEDLSGITLAAGAHDVGLQRVYLP